VDVDRDLVEQAQRGDREAFAILARSHGDRLIGIAHRILRDLSRAEDAVQQTLVIAWRELPRLRDPDRFGAWIDRTLVHACYAEARRARAWGAHIRVLAVEPAAPDSSSDLADRDVLGRNETDQPAVDITVIMAPVGAPFRQELTAPGPHCGF
jgi:RNA polymerase sigma-70 factor, ECF subfamily